MVVGWKCDDRGDPGDEIECSREGLILDACGQSVCVECARAMALDDAEYLPPGMAVVVEVLTS